MKLYLEIMHGGILVPQRMILVIIRILDTIYIMKFRGRKWIRLMTVLEDLI